MQEELGTTLAAFPNDGEGLTNPAFVLLDEGIPILARHAKRRHFRLRPLPFRNALAQSVRLGCLTGPVAEAERVKATLDRSSVAADSFCVHDVMWYDSLEGAMTKKMWDLCRASPGFFVVSCECDIPDSEEGDAA
eukprot:CAMPEP_0172548808 /NCGR_PEP_ID=MMETSP1067-20121228/18025_1 /TAXON_ID=265564 ORGANISM="Thalassiosira punctigera, Strain Tpunct2005C2" /NCGR_SAMPLE_ID=MMETSP1067 /ASSEMBLY_ACC=CAM_ASM_000444 /LENGTH=134 /DNA_ID=CAMNT_0013336081 /DNA_START=286 /DNA_END=688 /DNA_ORIENTATION=-